MDSDEEDIHLAAAAAAAAASQFFMFTARAAEFQAMADEEDQKYSRSPGRVFDWDSYDDDSCAREFIFFKSEIEEMVEILGITEILYPQRLNPDPVLALCFVLERLSFPKRYKDFYFKYGYTKSSQSHIFTAIIRRLYDSYKDIIEWNDYVLSPKKIKEYANDISGYTNGAVENVWGFIEGTSRRVCIPSTRQDEYYSEKKKYHCLKFQGFVTPDGLLSLYGPEKGAVADPTMLANSGITDKMKSYFPHVVVDESCPFNLYGDAEYVSGFGILRNEDAAEDLNRFAVMNNLVSSQKMVSEWRLNVVSKLFAFADMKRSQKVHSTMPAETYVVSSFLINLLCCYRRGNVISKKFNAVPPTVYEYLGIDDE